MSQMDADQFVPIGIIANFNQIKKLTNDIKLVTQVLRGTYFIMLDMFRLRFLTPSSMLSNSVTVNIVYSFYKVKVLVLFYKTSFSERSI